ncbi:DUF1206 domain-containing protein [Kribbella jejuensis]|uniref:Uncharacterized protein DUF1206 n=1 Tax=Kribbella jejuensis TaxID=236068 RepID=A0A542E8P2_9ACTN|nr:uncharacterized protein DUF1206 [Kribbella jejuensis]
MSTAQEVRYSRPYGLAITVGLIAYGLVYLLIALIAVQLAFGHAQQEATQQGALEELAGTPFGHLLLWIVAIGLFALVIWRVLELVWGHLKLQKKLSSIGRGIVYLVLGISAVKVANGAGASSSGTQRTMSARVMEHPAGRVLIVAIGVAIIAIACYQLYKAYSKNFTEDLAGGISDVTILLGRIGYAAKGIAFLVMGVMFGWAAISYDPQKAGGLDTALHTIKDQPFGTVLLAVLAAGIACFGLYCFIWSCNARR